MGKGENRELNVKLSFATHSCISFVCRVTQQYICKEYKSLHYYILQTKKQSLRHYFSLGSHIWQNQTRT